MKSSNTPLYIYTSSNHPPGIIKNIPLAVNKRLSSISSDAENFNREIEPYQNALHRSGYTHQLQYQSENTTTKTYKNRKRNITWYNPPFNKAAKTNVGRKFLNIIRNTFKASNPLKKIFNKNSLQISYSCRNNICSTTAGNNKKQLNKTPQQPVKSCNC